MRVTGTVVAAGGERARVRVTPAHACSRCGGCLLHAQEEGSTVIEAVDRLGSRPGDLVELEMPGCDLLKAAAVLYLVPLALAALGYLAGRWVVEGNAELGGLVGGLLSFVLSFRLLRRFDDQAQAAGSCLPVVVRAVEGSEERG